MKTHLENLKLPTSIWHTFHRLDQLLNQRLSWSKRLESVNDILIEELEIEAVWLLTLPPLPPTACGTMCTPLAIAPHAKIHIVDKSPPLEKFLPEAETIIGQVIYHQIPDFIDTDDIKKIETDSDLGDVLFGTFEAIPSTVIPLIADAEPVGALIIGGYDFQQIPSSEESVNLFKYLGEHIGANLKSAYLIHRSHRHTNVLETLNLIAQTITSSLNIDEVIQRTMIGINALLDVEAGSLLMADEAKEELSFKITLRGENKQITSYRLKYGEGIAGWVVQNNQPTIVNNPLTDKRFLKKIDDAIGFVTNTILCVPLMVHGASIGALEVLNKRSGPFDYDDMELLSSMAAALGIALHNAQLYEEAQARVKRHEIISQISTAINAGHGFKESGKLIFEQLGSFIEFDHLSLSLLDDAKQNIHQWELSEHGTLEYSRSLIPLENSALAHIVETNQILAIDDITQPNVSAPDDQILLDDEIFAKISLPLITKTTPYGCITLGRKEIKSYQLRDLQILEAISPHISVAIEKSRLIDAMEQHNSELIRLNHLSEMLVSTTDLGLIIDTSLSMMPRLLPGDVQGIIIMGEEGAYLGVAVPFDFSRTAQIIKDIQETFVDVREDTIPTKVIYDKTIAGNMPVSADWKPQTVLHLPLLTRLGTLGLIYIASGVNETLSDEMWRTFSLIGSQISAAVENARLFQQVEQERARLAAILSSSTDAILAVNRDGRIVLDNPAAWSVMDVEESQRDNLLAESTSNIELIQLFQKATQGGEPTGEISLNDGRTFYANLSPVEVDTLGVIGHVATMQDVSHFKEVNQLKTDFVNSVSHDLRSPLSGILIAVHLLPEVGEMNETQNELLQTIENRVNNMSRLIEDLLDVGKIEAGIDMELEVQPLASLVEEVTNSLKPQAQDKYITLSTYVPEDSPVVQANATRLRQVIYNLVGNAIKYTPNEGEVKVNLFEQDNEIRLQVIDTGMGIPTSDQPHIFEKFYRVRGDHVAHIKGTGLGLAITKGIVEKHNGRIWIESVFGEGSTFTVALPTYNGTLAKVASPQ